MKLLRVISGLDPRGGGPMEGARRIDMCLRDMGHSVEVACMDSPGQPYHQSYPAEVHALGPARANFGFTPRLVPWLRENVSRFDAAIVNGLWQYHGLAALRTLPGRIPYFVFTHGMLDPWFKETYPLKHVKKWMYWPWADYRLLRNAEAVLFTSEEERIRASKSFWLYGGVEKVVPYGTTPPPENGTQLANAFRLKHPELVGKRTFLFLSRIHEKKGCEELIRAFSTIADKHPAVHLVMAGPGDDAYVARLKTLAASVDLSNRISWVGMLEGDEKWGAFHAAEAFCLPSHQENFGIVVAESLACGTPVLISNKVNIWREVVADGAGFVGQDDERGACEVMRQWLELDDGAALKMRRAAIECFESRYQIQRSAMRLVELVKEARSAAA